MRRLIALLVIVSVVAMAPIAAGQTGVYPVDSNHPLAEQDAIQEYQATGSVSANLTALDVGITIADDHEDANMSGVYTDTGKTWVCIDYRESIERTLRINIPSEYFEPRPGKIDSATSDRTAEFASREDGAYTAVKVSFDGPSRACFAVTAASGAYWSAKDKVNRWVNNTTGWELPELRSEPGQWRSLTTAAFENSTQHRIPTKGETVTVQYDAEPGPETQWIRVPECQDVSDQEICRYTEAPNQTDSSNATVVLMSTQETPPPVRYKYGSDRSAGIMSGLHDATSALGDFWDDLGGWLGSGGGDD